MENASKALLIAGSVLIVILLIAVGVRIFNSTHGTAESVETTMSATEIATFNNKFIAYAGKKKSAAQAKALANVVIANNATNATHTVSFDTKTSASDITNYVANLSGSGTISVDDENQDGLIDKITTNGYTVNN